MERTQHSFGWLYWKEYLWWRHSLQTKHQGCPIRSINYIQIFLEKTLFRERVLSYIIREKQNPFWKIKRNKSKPSEVFKYNSSKRWIISVYEKEKFANCYYQNRNISAIKHCWISNSMTGTLKLHLFGTSAKCWAKYS